MHKTKVMLVGENNRECYYKQVNRQRYTAQYPNAIAVVSKIFNSFVAKIIQNPLFKSNIKDVWDIIFT